MSAALDTNEEKLEFLVRKYFKLSQKKLADTFGVSETEMSKIVKNRENKLKNVHLLAFCQLHKIPHEIFNNKKLNSEEKLRDYLDDYQKEIEEKEAESLTEHFPFYENSELLSKLVGVWYAYSFGTNPKDGNNGIYNIKTTIHTDRTVSDVNGNRGKLFLGRNQSTIIKESTNSKDLVTIVFNNTEISYGLFHFTLVSKRNIIRRSMCNFGFFSKEKLKKEEYMKILGDNINEMQFQMASGFEERVLG